MSQQRTGNTRRPDRAALVIAAFLALLAAIIAYSTATAHGGSATLIGPAVFPYAIAGALFILSLWTVAEALRGDFPEREAQQAGPVVWIVGGLSAQMLLLNFVGFSIATGLLFAATARAFGKKKLWLTVPVGIILSFVVWVLFSKGLQLSLPAGPIERLAFGG
ncbi:tripartite tricarboxylate transporter TctB family protein [Phyllobacterium sp. 21LDTY02-6]|uniref:tripartite tricarboxylate transporter TctB family protein n=1 Tax=Phyllobacterium sp. 21LDTY02-6 TaxID=2944903 RepID=UPI002021FBA7|nr:tripartite tricarboxylate transporter TctB family protein [Phyllobacterium sp. 21LDTY02-6]MCO4316896.1 tripartite tricarboxylate transporter TctB family protein [Phyllobacterium sp. 21LDTY02-6]